MASSPHHPSTPPGEPPLSAEGHHATFAWSITDLKKRLEMINELQLAHVVAAPDTVSHNLAGPTLARGASVGSAETSRRPSLHGSAELTIATRRPSETIRRPSSISQHSHGHRPIDSGFDVTNLMEADSGADGKPTLVANFTHKHPHIVKLTLVLVFYILGAVVYTSVLESFSLLDAVYFITVTTMTIGYGDFHPSTDGSRLFTIFYIILGLSVVGSILVGYASDILESHGNALMKRMDDDPNDDVQPHRYKVIFAFGTVVLCVFVGCIFFMLNEDWTFIAGLYWAVVTTSSVGYGDLSITKESSKIFVIFYIICCSGLVASALGTASSVAIEMKVERRRQEHMKRKITLKMILDMDNETGDGDGRVDSGEYLAACLIYSGLLSKEDVEPVLKRFKELDVDGSGFLDKSDIVTVNQPLQIGEEQL